MLSVSSISLPVRRLAALSNVEHDLKIYIEEDDTKPSQVDKTALLRHIHSLMEVRSLREVKKTRGVRGLSDMIDPLLENSERAAERVIGLFDEATAISVVRSLKNGTDYSS